MIRGLDLVQVLAVSLSFAAGILIVIGVARADGGNTIAAPSEEAHTIATNGQALARAVGEPSTPFGAEGEPVTEVAGVSCELDPLSQDATSGDVLEAWNSSVVSAGEACVAPFADTLGSAWLMTDAELSIFGADGSLYEFANVEGPLESLSIFLVVEDSLNGEAAELGALIDTVWGAETIDWSMPCDETERSWSGSVSSDALAIEIVNCVEA